MSLKYEPASETLHKFEPISIVQPETYTRHPKPQALHPKSDIMSLESYT